MARVADVRLYWTKSPSADVSKVKVVVTQNGVNSETEFGPEVQELVVIVHASTVMQFKVVVFDAEGNQSTSETYLFTLGDLTAPLPATNLGHEVLAVRDMA